jgi:hypothetical protein
VEITAQDLVHGVRDRVVSRERLGEVGARGLSDAALVTEIDFPRPHEDVSPIPGRQVGAIAVILSG